MILEIVNGWAIFLEHGFLDEKKELSAGPVLTETEKKQSVDVIKKKPSTNYQSGSKTFDFIIDSSTRPIDGSGRKRKKEWNQSEALDFGRQLQKIIQDRKREEQPEHGGLQHLAGHAERFLCQKAQMKIILACDPFFLREFPQNFLRVAVPADCVADP